MSGLSPIGANPYQAYESMNRPAEEGAKLEREANEVEQNPGATKLQAVEQGIPNQTQVLERIKHANGCLYLKEIHPGGRVIEKAVFSNSTYIGEFKNRIPHGKGRKERPNGDYEDGQFLNGKFISGRIKITFANGGFYEGEVRRGGERHGQGREIWPNADYEDGQFENDAFIIGRVKRTSPNGNVYEGQWELTLGAHGEGILRFAGGLILEGKFVKNEFIDGIVRYPNGLIYEGQCGHNGRSGYGTLFQPDGTVLNEGYWSDDAYIGPNPPAS